MLIIPMMMNYSKFDIFGIFGLLNKLTGIDLRINLLNTVWTVLSSVNSRGWTQGRNNHLYLYPIFQGLALRNLRKRRGLMAQVFSEPSFQ